MMEIKVGEKYLWEPYGDVVTVIAGPDSDGDYCVRCADDSFVIVSSHKLKPLRTPEEVERDKIANEVAEVSKLLNATGEACRLIANYILENYIRKDDPRVVEPITPSELGFLSPIELEWLTENKHICVKVD